ncbi:hypothetical protein UlMin_007075 [Ulmus minor]
MFKVMFGAYYEILFLTYCISFFGSTDCGMFMVKFIEFLMTKDLQIQDFVMAYNEGNVNFCNHKFYGMLIAVRDLFLVQAGTSFIYLVAENSVVKINLFTGTFEPAAQVILSFQPDKDGNGRGLFAFSVHGQLIWSAGPVLNQFGYPQGCRKNATDCYFTSVPVIDQCKASIYISSTEGELYSLSIPTPHFRWIQDLSSFDKEFTVTPGNNGRLYVVVPGSIGPLSSLDSAPVVDSNGWISLGSLDGFLYSFSPDGVLKKFSKAIASDSAIQVGPVLDCSGYAVYISQTEMEGKSSRVVGYYTYTSSLKPNQIKYNRESDDDREVLDTGGMPAKGTPTPTRPVGCGPFYGKLISNCFSSRGFQRSSIGSLPLSRPLTLSPTWNRTLARVCFAERCGELVAEREEEEERVPSRHAGRRRPQGLQAEQGCCVCCSGGGASCVWID